MRVISRKKLREAWALNPELEKPLSTWFRIAEKAAWGCFSDVRATFKSVGHVRGYFVFNILGNRYRLICNISFPKRKVYVRHVRPVEGRLGDREASHGERAISCRPT